MKLELMGYGIFRPKINGIWDTQTPRNGASMVSKTFSILINTLLSSLKAKDEVLGHLVVARPQMLQEVTQLSVVVIKATHQRNKMTVNAVVRRSKYYHKN